MDAHRFVAHRGFQAEYPENTLIGVEAALDCGARWVEIDIQLSRDGVPVVIHDPDLQRTSESTLVVGHSDWVDLSRIEVGEPDRLGSRFQEVTLCRLRELLQLVSRYPQARAFVEIKQHALGTHSAAHIAEQVLADYPAASLDCPIISFDPSILLAVRARSEVPIGLVLSEYDQAQHDWLQQHQPEWVFCNYHKPSLAQPLWPGEWQWVMYPVNAVETAQQWLQHGADLIETDDIDLMISDSAQAALVDSIEKS